MATRVYTSGVFDLFHAGHIQALELAKSQGTALIVGVLSDEDAESYKRRPIIPFVQRLAIIEKIKLIDEVVVGPKYETRGFYRSLNIDLHCQGDQLDGFYEVAKELGILRILGRSLITDTSSIIRRVISETGKLGEKI